MAPLPRRSSSIPTAVLNRRSSNFASSRFQFLPFSRNPFRHPPDPRTGPASASPARDPRAAALQRHPSLSLTPEELVEIRAAQRTFDFAYLRTAIGLFAFSLVVLKVFTAEFYGVGALFAAYGGGVLLISLFRRAEGYKQFFDEAVVIGGDRQAGGGAAPGAAGGGQAGGGEGSRRKFRTSGNVVVILTALSVGAYVGLLVLVLKLKEL